MGDKPKRIQLSRAKGWRMPENTVKVDRSTRWGNHWTVAAYRAAGFSIIGEAGELSALRTCCDAYRAWLLGQEHWAHGCTLPPVPDLSALRGKNLACWCSTERRHPAGAAICHADVLLDLANSQDTPARGGE